MKLKIPHSLIIVDVLVVVLILAILLLPDSWLRIVVGLPFLLFFPGYVLIETLFVRGRDAPPAFAEEEPVKKPELIPAVEKPAQGRKGKAISEAEQTEIDSDSAPRRGMDDIERVALSFGMSIAITALIGLGLNYTPWGIRLLPVLFSISAFIIILSAVAYFRQVRHFQAVQALLYENRHRWKPDQTEKSRAAGGSRNAGEDPASALPPLEGSLEDAVHPWSFLQAAKKLALTQRNFKLPGWEGSRLNKALTLILVLSILAAIGTLIFTVAFPKVGERFTEFYILGNKGKAADYPSQFKLSQGMITSVSYDGGNTFVNASEARVILGVVCQEQQPSTYSVKMKIDGEEVPFKTLQVISAIPPATPTPTSSRRDSFLTETVPVGEEAGLAETSLRLEQAWKWEGEIAFAPRHAGENQKVEFLLFKDGAPEVYNELHLWVTVTEP